MSTPVHRSLGLISLFSIAALAALGCSSGLESIAGPDDGPGDPGAAAEDAEARQADSSSNAHEKKCKRHIGVHAHWMTEAPLPAARTRHSAQRMPDGQVLVAGGFGAYPYPTSVELYNPAADTWTSIGSLSADTVVVRPALLPDGRVLFSPGGYVFDPSTGTSTAVPLTPGESVNGWPYANSTLTPLPNGLVLRTGGDDDWDYLNEAVLYNPATNTWSSAGTMSVTRGLHTATLLNDGRVLVVGGYTLNSYELPQGRTSVDIYDPATGTWTAAAPTNVPRMQHTATLLSSGHVLVIGGGGVIYSGTGEEDLEIAVDAGDTAEIYDAASNTWTSTSPPTFHYGPGHAAARMSHGRAMAIDSYGAEIYKESSDTWTVIDDPTPRSWHTATALQDGAVLITGGDDATVHINSPPITSVERYGRPCKHH